MIKVKMGAAMEDFDLLDFFEMPEESVRASWAGKSATISTDEENYMELAGKFVGEGDDKALKKLLAATSEINGMTTTVDGELYMEVKGLKIGARELASVEALQKYLSKSSYDITGNKDGNILNGAGGDDIIDGGRGKDSIIGNGGDDELTGGIGADHFIYHKGDGSDVITDFTARGGDADTIDLSEYGEKIRFRDLHISRVDKTDVLIEIGRHEDILLHDVKLRHISVDDFDF